jgi:hypothetical protein
MRPTPLHVFLGIALAASLAVNAILLWPTEKPAAAKAPPARRAAESSKAKPEANPVQELRACEDRLKARQAKDALRSLAAGLRASLDEKPEGANDDGARGEMRCRIAEQQLRDRWREKEKETIANVRKSLSNPQDVENSTVGDGGRYAKSLGLDETERERFIDRYRPIRSARSAEIDAALGAEPVDYARVEAGFRGLCADEDRLISELYGREASERFAADAEEGRLGVLMIIAAWSGGEFPESVD